MCHSVEMPEDYIYFDKNMEFHKTGFIQISTDAQGVGVHEMVELDPVIADKEGYILGYLTNENTQAVTVHFDDFSLYHGKTNVIQTQDFYPFGLLAESKQVHDNFYNPYLYNQQSRLEEETGWYHTPFRKYDAAIGRFNGVDALAASMPGISGYAYAFNNPVNMSDPSGLSPSNGPVPYMDSNGGGGGGMRIAGRYQHWGATNWDWQTAAMMLSGGDFASWVSGSTDAQYALGVGVGARNYTADERMAAVQSMNTSSSLDEIARQLGFNDIIINPDRANPDKVEGGRLAVGNDTYVITVLEQLNDFFSYQSEGIGDKLQPSVDRVGDLGGFLVSMAETPFVITSGELGMLGKMKNIPYSQKKRVLNQYTKGAVRGLRTTSRAAGVAGLAFGAGVSTFNLSTGNGELSDIADLVVLGTGVLIIGAAGTAAAPFVAAGGLIYGGIMLFGGENYINNSAAGQAVRGYLDF